MKEKIIYTKYGLSNKYKNHIEINKKLKAKKYKKLRDYIIKHEQAHDLNKFDLFHEFNFNIKIIPSLLWFVATTPSSWIDFFPIQYRNKKIIYDINMLLLYLIIVIVISFSFFSF